MTEYLDFKAATRYMGFNTYAFLRQAIAAGLPVVVIGKSRRISKTAIDEFMKAHTVVADQGGAGK